MKNQIRTILAGATVLFAASLSSCMQTSLEISSVADTMTYDKTVLEVKAGETVKLTLKNGATSPAMIHNWVLHKPGTTEALITAAMAAGQGKNFLPDSPDILAHTNLVSPGQSTTIEFKAPEKAGEYPYMCTYPGHFALMKGILKVM